VARETSAKQVTAILSVETNFIIGIVWEQRPVLLRIKKLCEQLGVLLAVPEIALAEARNSLLQRIERHLIASQQFRFWLNDIARAAGIREQVRQIKRCLDGIEAELQRRKQLILEALEMFAQACTIVPLTPQVWARAYVRWKANMPPFKELDCLVAETLLEFLRKRRAKLSLFLTMDAEDFDHPELHADFKRHRTNMLFDPYAVIVEFRKFYGVA
jgi:hypothetical protein